MKTIIEHINLVYLLISSMSFIAYSLIAKIWKQKSYSDSYYDIKYRPLQPLFIITYVLPMAAIWGQDAPLIVLACLLIGWVAPVANFLGDDGQKGTSDDSKKTYNLHMIFSIGGVLFAFFAFAFTVKNSWIYSIVSLILISLIYTGTIKTKNKITIIEAYALIYSLIITLIVKCI